MLVSLDGAAVSVALAARLATPLALGAEFEADVRVEVLRAALSDAAPSAQFVTGLIAVVALGAPGDTPLRLGLRADTLPPVSYTHLTLPTILLV